VSTIGTRAVTMVPRKRRFIAHLVVLFFGTSEELVSAAPLPTTLPTDTTSLDYHYDGYSGTIPTQFGLLTNMKGPLYQRSTATLTLMPTKATTVTMTDNDVGGQNLDVTLNGTATSSDTVVGMEAMSMTDTATGAACAASTSETGTVLIRPEQTINLGTVGTTGANNKLIQQQLKASVWVRGVGVCLPPAVVPQLFAIAAGCVAGLLCARQRYTTVTITNQSLD
jgi:hypothetical protein